MDIIKLSATITKGERTISELTFADPKVRHLLAADGHDPDSNAAVVALASALTGEPEILLGELPPEDWVKVRTISMNAYYKFMGLDWTAAVVQAALLAGKMKAAAEGPSAAAEKPGS